MLTNTEPTNQTFTNKNRVYIFLGAVFMIFTVCCFCVVLMQTNAHGNLIAKKHGLQSVILGEEQEQRNLKHTHIIPTHTNIIPAFIPTASPTHWVPTSSPSKH